MAKANYDLPEKELLKVKSLAHARSKKEAIVIALNNYIHHKKIERLIAAEGKFSLKWTKSSLKKYRD